MNKKVIIPVLLIFITQLGFSQPAKVQLNETRERYYFKQKPTINLLVIDKRQKNPKHSARLKKMLVTLMQESYPNAHFRVIKSKPELKRNIGKHVNLAITINDYQTFKKRRLLIAKTSYNVHIVDFRGDKTRHFKKEISHVAKGRGDQKTSPKKVLRRSFIGTNKKLIHFINQSVKAVQAKKHLAQKQRSEFGKTQTKNNKVSEKQKSEKSELSDIDENIPQTGKKYPNRYALIIGNQDYSSYQKSLSSEVDVKYAINDAETFKQYAIKTLGIPEENIIFKTNAKVVEFNRSVEKIEAIIKNLDGEAEIFFYYAGHGFPGEKTKEPYLMPVDVSGTDLEYAIELESVYENFTKHPAKRITVFLDACFSGGARNQGLMAARGVKITPKEQTIKGNMVVFTASNGQQSSLPYEEKNHGLFTYYLLKKIQESEGQITYKELYDYLEKQIPVKSVMVNDKEQNPKVNVSPALKENWEEWELQ